MDIPSLHEVHQMLEGTLASSSSPMQCDICSAKFSGINEAYAHSCSFYLKEMIQVLEARIATLEYMILPGK